MDKTLIKDFITQVNELMENNTKLTNLVETTQNENIILKSQVESKDKQINEQIDKIKKLEADNNAKSSKSIWEGTQQQIKEKDSEIDELKKTIEFLKRQQTINPIPAKLEAKQEAKPEVETKLETKLETKPKKKEKLIVNTQSAANAQTIVKEVNKEKNVVKTNNKNIILDDLDELERELMMK